MKVSQLFEDPPLLLAAMNAAMKRGDRIAWYLKRGDKSVPVWISDWRETTKKYEDGPQQAIVFRGYQGFNVTLRTIRLDTMDDEWTLVPGKTKNTFRLVRSANVVNEGRGDDVMTFMDYLDKGIVAKKYKHLFEKLGAELFAKGATLNQMRYNVVLYLHDSDDRTSHWKIAFPHSEGAVSKSGVEVTYAGNPSTFKAMDFYHISAISGHLDDALQEVKAHATA